MLSNVEVSVGLLRCDVCGSTHFTAKEAGLHGCGNALPQPKFKVGDRVLADLTLGQGMSACGEAKLPCKVIKVGTPREFSTGIRNRRGGFLPWELAAKMPLFSHDWFVEVEPENTRVIIDSSEYSVSTEVKRETEVVLV